MLPTPTKDTTPTQTNMQGSAGRDGAGSGAEPAWAVPGEEGESANSSGTGSGGAATPSNKDSPFNRLKNNQAAQAKQRQNQFWPSLEEQEEAETAATGDQPKRNLYTHEQIKWLKQKLHTTMDDHFDLASTQLCNLFYQQKA